MPKDVALTGPRGILPRGILKVSVQTGASRNEVVGFRGGVLQVKVTAAPERGRANAAVLDLVARAVKVPKTSVKLLRGRTSKAKTMAFDDLSPENLRSRLGGVGRRDEL
jgi:uncharacterized protein (TIGR00251 family)